MVEKEYEEFVDALIDNADLPVIINEQTQGTGIKIGRESTIFAVWRGSKETPSVSVFKGRSGTWFFKDHGNADAGQQEGNAYQFLVNIKNFEHKEAIEYLSRHTGISQDNYVRKERVYHETIEHIPLGESLETGKLEYLKKLDRSKIPEPLQGRGFTEKDVTYNGYGSDEKGNALIPIFDPKGNTIAVKVRKPKGQVPRYYYHSGGEHSPPKCNRNFKAQASSINLFIIEGELNADIVDSVLREHNEFVPIIGLSGNKCNLYEGVAKGKNVYLYLDSINSLDYKKKAEALKAQVRFFNILKDQGANKVIALPSLDEHDFCDVANEGRDKLHEVFKQLLKDSKEIDHTVHPSFGIKMSSLMDFKEETLSGEVKYPTGFRDVDIMSMGLAPYGTTLVCGLSGHGKSSFIRQIALHSSKVMKYPVKFYSTEESVQNFIRSMVDLTSMIPINEITKPTVTPYIKEVGGKEEAMNLWNQAFELYVRFGYKDVTVMKEDKLDKILADIEREYLSGKYAIFVVDYVQKVRNNQGKLDPDEASIRLSDLASDLAIPIVLSVQLAKSKFDIGRASGIPTVTDIEGVGGIFQACDVAWFLYSQEQYMANFSITNRNDYRAYDPDDNGKARVIQHKSRGKPLNWEYLEWVKEQQILKSVQVKLTNSKRV